MNGAIISGSQYPFDETMARLTNAISACGNAIFADVDQSAAAKSVGLTLRPTRLLIFGNPKSGTPLMEAFPLVALDLPLKIVAWEENGEVVLAYAAPSAIAGRYDVTGKDGLIASMTHAFETIVASVNG